VDFIGQRRGGKNLGHPPERDLDLPALPGDPLQYLPAVTPVHALVEAACRFVAGGALFGNLVPDVRGDHGSSVGGMAIPTVSLFRRHLSDSFRYYCTLIPSERRF